MYLPHEIDPVDETLHLVIVPTRATGAREIHTITTDPAHANRIADLVNGYVLAVTRTADHR